MFDPQNLGLDTLILQVSVVLAEILAILGFSCNGGLICI